MASANLYRGGDREGGVGRLEATEQGEEQVGERPARDANRERLPICRKGPVLDTDLLSEVPERDADLRGPCLDDGAGLRRKLPDHTGHSRVENPGLLASDRGEVRPQ